jgi:hypothetical protein
LYPVRCQTCNLRFSAPIREAMELPKAHSRRVDETFSEEVLSSLFSPRPRAPETGWFPQAEGKNVAASEISPMQSTNDYSGWFFRPRQRRTGGWRG